jgi:DNA-directed RNA polymerase subunit L
MSLPFTIKLNKYKPHSNLSRGELSIVFKNYDDNDPFINSIGRIACKRIPVYAVPPELIDITKVDEQSGYHDSVPFNYDMMRARISYIPIMNLDPEIGYLNEKYWKDVDYLDKHRDKHDDEADVELYVHVKNNSLEHDENSIINVTTNDLQITINNQDISPNKLFDKDYPFLIISLKPREAFECSMKAVIGIGLNNSVFDSGSNYYIDHNETIKDSSLLTIQASSRFNEFQLFNRSMEYFETRILNIKNEVEKKYMELDDESRNNTFLIVLKDEDHTIGEPLNYMIQSHKNIIMSACKKPDNLINEIEIFITCDKKNQDNLLKYIMESFDSLINKIQQTQKEFNKIAKKEESKHKYKSFNPITIDGDDKKKKFKIEIKK